MFLWRVGIGCIDKCFVDRHRLEKTTLHNVFVVRCLWLASRDPAPNTGCLQTFTVCGSWWCWEGGVVSAGGRSWVDLFTFTSTRGSVVIINVSSSYCISTSMVCTNKCRRGLRCCISLNWRTRSWRRYITLPLAVQGGVGAIVPMARLRSFVVGVSSTTPSDLIWTQINDIDGVQR